ncbi:MAG: bifunctional serine/threonine-protein kinase/formylglycine-generating enzyme family protein, partial [Gammaproteobacteria bacterium]
MAGEWAGGPPHDDGGPRPKTYSSSLGSATAGRPQVLPAGFVLLWYRITSVLGRGNFGVTYLAMDTNLDRQVAIKEYLPSAVAVRELDGTLHVASDEHGGEYSWGLGRFLNEGRTLARFNHPNIVRVHNVFEANNTAYMVMEYERGESLRERMKRRKPSSDADLLALLLPLCDGLRKTHEAGYIHRDIKPANIFIRGDGVPVLLDFGSARVVMENRDTVLTKIVSRGFAPCEQYDETSGRQGPWTDIYALGATAYALIAGTTPADSISRVNARLESRTDPLRPAVNVGKGRFSAQLLYAIDAALRLRPDERPANLSQWCKLFPSVDLAEPDESWSEVPPTEVSMTVDPEMAAFDDGLMHEDASALAAIDSARSTRTSSLSASRANVQDRAASSSVRRVLASVPHLRTLLVGAFSILGFVVLPVMVWWLWSARVPEVQSGSGPSQASSSVTVLSSSDESAPENEGSPAGGDTSSFAEFEVEVDNEAGVASQSTADPGLKTFRDAESSGEPGPEMVVVPPGEFRMGAIGESGLAPGLRSVRLLRIGKSFAIGRHEITFEEYDRFAHATRRRLPYDRGWGRADRPVISVSWNDATAYARWLSKQTGERYRLPSESEWEYAARAGSETGYWWGDEPGEGRAHCNGCESGFETTKTVPVGSFEPNPLGLFDTAGNVWEWVQD